MKKLFLGFICLPFFVNCSTGNCRSQSLPDTTPPEKLKEELKAVTNESTLKVRVFKSDGSKQCGQGNVVSLEEMEKQLKEIKVYTKYKKNDRKTCLIFMIRI